MEQENEYKLDLVSVRLVHDAPLLSDHKIDSPKAAVQVMGEFMSEVDREVMCVINLRSDGTPINGHIASIGALNQTLASPRELLKAAILSNAAQMILLHCHPSGSLVPSKEDIDVTNRMIEICDLVGIPLADHIIIGGNNRQEYFSFRAKGILRNAEENRSQTNGMPEFDSSKAAEPDAAKEGEREERRSRKRKCI